MSHYLLHEGLLIRCKSFSYPNNNIAYKPLCSSLELLFIITSIFKMNTSAFNDQQTNGLSHACAENERKGLSAGSDGNLVMDRFVGLQATTGSTRSYNCPPRTKNGIENQSIPLIHAPSMKAISCAARTLPFKQAVASSSNRDLSCKDHNDDHLVLGSQDYHAVPKPSRMTDGNTYSLRRQSRHAPHNSVDSTMGDEDELNPKDIRVVSETESSKNGINIFADRRPRRSQSLGSSAATSTSSDATRGLNLISNIAAAAKQHRQQQFSQRAAANSQELLRMQNHATNNNRNFLQPARDQDRASATSVPSSQFASMHQFVEQERRQQQLLEESALHCSSSASSSATRMGNLDTIIMDNYYTRMLIDEKKRRIELEKELLLESIMMSRKRQRLLDPLSLPAAAATRGRRVSLDSSTTSPFTSIATGGASAPVAVDDYSLMLLKRKRMQDEHQAAALAAASRAHQDRLMIEAEIRKLDTFQTEILATRNGATTYPLALSNNNNGLDFSQIQGVTRNNLISTFLDLNGKEAVTNPSDNEGRCHEVNKKKEPEFVSLKKSKSKPNREMNHDIENITPNKQHYSKRPYMHLGTDSDDIWLSKFLTFLRTECIEVFTASQSDVYERKTSKKIQVNQVGLRCRFCAHLPYRARVVRSSCFPSSICRIYQSLTMMIREHYSRCPAMPEEIRHKYTELKWMTKKGEIESKTHWIESAKSVGMVDSEQGIFLNKPLRLTYPDTSSTSRGSDDKNEEEKDTKKEEESFAADGMAI